MKKRINILLISVLMCNVLFAQTEKKNISTYMSAGISISNGNNFKKNSYSSIEIGKCIDNLCIGLNVGKADLDFDTNENYYVELKAAPSLAIGIIKVYFMMGLSNYINSKYLFIEYGSGVSYSYKKIDFSTQITNFDGTNYIGYGITYNL